MYEDEHVGFPAFFAFVVFVMLGVASVGFVLTHPPQTTEQEFDLWDAKCPFGYYYTDVSGGGIFFVADIDSTLGEAYVLKYLDGGALKTLIVDSTDNDVRVVFTENTERMWFIAKFEGKTLETTDEEESTNDWFWITIRVPDPKAIEQNL